MSTKLTPEILLENGWDFRGGLYVKKDKVRIGWYLNGTTIVGYHEFPTKITTVEQMIMLQSLLENELLIN